MSCTKTYMHILAIITLFSCSQSLVAMKKFQDHDFKIINNEEIPNFLDPKTVTVSHSSFLGPKRQQVVLNRKTIAVCNLPDFVEIWDIMDGFGKCNHVFDNEGDKITNIIGLSAGVVAFGDEKGFLTIWNFNQGKHPLIRFFKTPISRILKLTKEKIAVVYNNGMMVICDNNGQHLKHIDLTKNINLTINMNMLKRLSKTKIMSTLMIPEVYNQKTLNRNKKIIIWDIETEKSSIVDFSPIINKFESKSSFRRNWEIKDLIKITKQTCVCAIGTKIVFFNVNSGEITKKLGRLWPVTELYKLSDGMLMSIENTGPWPGENIVHIWDLKKLQNFKHSLSFAWADSDICIQHFELNPFSTDYFKESKTLVFTTNNGGIITIQCASNNKKSNDLNYLFQNLNISKDKKSFKDLGFKFKYNYDTEN